VTLSALEREFLFGIFPWERHDMTDSEFGELVDAWYAQDHYESNHVYNFEPEAQQ